MTTSQGTSPAMKLVKTGAAKQAEPVDTTAAESVTESKAKVTAPVIEDLIMRTAHEVESLKQDKALKMVPSLLDGVDYDQFKLGGVLTVIHANGWHMDKGYETFRAYVEAECGMKYRRAMYFINNYNALVKSGIPWDLVKDLGWCRLKELATILSMENVAEWVEVAKDMTIIQLQQHIKESTKGDGGDNAPSADTDAAKAITTMTFKLHQDQKDTVREALNKAKHSTGSDVDSVALEAMALDFLGGEAALKAKPTLVQLMTGKSIQEVLEAVGTVFPHATISVELEE